MIKDYLDQNAKSCFLLVRLALASIPLWTKKVNRQYHAYFLIMVTLNNDLVYDLQLAKYSILVIRMDEDIFPSILTG
jgi:hypothetical protein